MTDDAKLRVACLQLSPTDDAPGNLDAALALATAAAAAGARLILLPEYAVTAALDLAAAAHVRTAIPALLHEQPFAVGDGRGGRPNPS